jgi:hypothetical protein
MARQERDILSSHSIDEAEARHASKLGRRGDGGKGAAQGKNTKK